MLKPQAIGQTNSVVSFKVSVGTIDSTSGSMMIMMTVTMIRIVMRVIMMRIVMRVVKWPRVNLVGATLSSRPVTSSPLKQVKDCEECRERFVQAHRLDPGTHTDVSFDAMIQSFESEKGLGWGICWDLRVNVVCLCLLAN